MKRIYCLLTAGVFLAGCVQVGGKEPLVRVERSGVGYMDVPASDPAPGVPDGQLTREQRLERALHSAQLKIRDLEKDKAKLKMKVDRLDDEKDHLEDMNKRLRKALKGDD